MTNTPLTSTPPDSRVHQQQSQFTIAVGAFLAIFSRDLFVAYKDFLSTLLQALIIPGLFLFIFGKVLPLTGAASPNYAAQLLPGQVAMTLFLISLTNVTLPLVLDIGNEREIEDRLLAPLPVAFVAIEKVLFAALIGFVTSLFIFPLSYLILGSQYSVRVDDIGALMGMMILSALAGASFGLTLGTAVKPEQIGVMNATVLLPLIFLGSAFFSWGSLASIRWFQIVTLFNPLTYAAEGMRAIMIPAEHGVSVPTLDFKYAILGLLMTILLFFFLGVRGFINRAIR
jgi:ABC-2 type transport system permease protein